MHHFWNKPRFGKLLTVLIAASLGLTAAFSYPAAGLTTVSAGESISELEARQKQVQSELDAVNDKISGLQGKIDEQAAYQEELTQQISLYKEKIQILDDQIAALEQDIEDKQSEITRLQDEIEQLEQDIADKQVEIDDTYELFKTRMVALYEAGETSSLAMLLSSNSFADFVTNIRLMQAVSKSDEKLVDELKDKLTEQQTLKTSQEEKKSGVETALVQVQEDEQAVMEQRQSQADAQAELEDAYSKSETAEQDMEALKAEYESDRDAKIAEDKQVESEIQAFYAELAKKQAAAEAAAKAAQQSSSSSSSTQTVVNTGSLSFRWPLPGYSMITSGYGARWGSTHTGIDISGGGVYGASIVAAESGTVVLAGSHWSYGNYVIVDHGGGYTTLYAHMSSLACSTGDYVSKGQTIGYVGSTGNSTGPHLHFEVRVNGATQNPSSYVHP